MIHRPRIRPDVCCKVVPGEGAFVFGEFQSVALIHPLAELIVPLIDGQRTSDDIADELAQLAPPQEVYYALSVLEGKGYICDNERAFSEAEDAFWTTAGLSAKAVRDVLSQAQVGFQEFGNASGAVLRNQLQEAGLRISADGVFDVVVAEDYLDSALADHNARALSESRSWMLFKIVGCQIWLGPLFVPRFTACWECLAYRLRCSRYLQDFVERNTPGDGAVRSAVARTPLTEQLAANFASHMIIKAIASGGGAFEGRILTIDLHSLQMQSHEVVRRPQCCRCGVAFPDGDPQIPTLQHRKKRFISDGGHRTISPEETLIRFQKHISPITGIVDKITRIGNIPNQHHQPPLHVYLARHNFAFKFKNMRSFAENMKSQSAGKGKTESQAKASALAEAIERYSAIFTGDEHRIRASLRELGESAIHPNDCMLFSQKQFRERQSDESGTTYTSRIPEPLPEDASLDWTPLYSLSKQRWRYLPTIYLYFPSTIGPTPHSRSSFFYGDSNGNASGNVIEEAILQGFLELLERDCVAIWWYNLARRPAVDLASFQDSVIDELVAAYQSLGREIWALDIRNDFGIPAVAAISRNVAGGPQDVLFGFGAHLDARIAVSRALTEMNQMLTLSEGINDSNGIGRNLDLELSHWFATATVENQPYLLPSDTLAPTRRENYPQLASDDVLADIELCKTIVHSLGMEMLILDQTRPDIDMPAVKVVVPGMRHFWPRFAPGRLYDVPVKLGWWPKALTEEQLNPVRMFF